MNSTRLLARQKSTESFTSSDYRVENFQIPVPLGDCSVHILLEKGKVKNAILIDGGKQSGGKSDHKVEWVIASALQEIDRKLPSQDEEWKIKTWVVTHWDADHYLGMINLLTTDNTKLQGIRDQFFQKKLHLVSGANPKVAEIGLVELSDHGEALLGLDLFSETKFLKKKDGEPNWDQHISAPQFIVIGANGYSISNDYVNGKWSNPSEKKPSPNQTSILALLVWPKKKKQPWRVSYFTGGDGHPKGEISALRWLQDRGLIQETSAVFKLDHHGSSYENIHNAADPKISYPSIGTVEVLKPRKVIVTPGGQYGHPCWDVLYFVLRYFKEQPGSGKDFKDFYTTRTPYWMTKEKVTAYDVNPMHLQRLQEFFKNRKITSKVPIKKKQGKNEKGNNEEFKEEYKENNDSSDSNWDIHDLVKQLYDHLDDFKGWTTKVNDQREAYRQQLQDADPLQDKVRKKRMTSYDKKQSKEVNEQLARQLNNFYDEKAIRNEMAKSRGIAQNSPSKQSSSRSSLQNSFSEEEEEATSVEEAQLDIMYWLETLVQFQTWIWNEISAQPLPSLSEVHYFLLHFTSMDNERDGTFDESSMKPFTIEQQPEPQKSINKEPPKDTDKGGKRGKSLPMRKQKGMNVASRGGGNQYRSML